MLIEPPHSVDVERAYLGAITLSPTLVHEHPVDESVFYLDKHRQIYTAMVEQIYEHGTETCSIRSVGALLEQRGNLETVGGLAYLSELADDLPDLSSIGHFVDVLEMYRDRRTLQRLGQRLTAESTASDPSELRDRTITALGQLGTTDKRDAYRSLAESAESVLTPDNPSNSIPLGLPDLDRILGGGQPGQLIIIAGRPGMGKTSFAVCAAGHLALRAGLPVAVRSMEMRERALLLRLAGWDLQIESRRLRTGHLTVAERADLERWVARASAAPLYISDAPGCRFARIAGELRSLRARRGIRAAFVDQLSFVSVDSTRSGEQGHEITNRLAHSFKSLAVELEIPIYLLHQLTRGPNQREDRQPRDSDLRGAGEEPADVILAPWRPFAHMPSADQSAAKVLILKHRDGATGEVPAVWIPETATYRGLESRR